MRRDLVLGMILVVAACSAAVGAARQQPAPSASAIEVDKVADNLYVLRGGGGNTAAFVTAGGVVLVDTKLPGWGRPMLDRLREITDKPVTTIINTHTHFDHVGGNVEFPATVEVVAHENTAKLMQEMRPVTGGPEQPQIFREHNGRGLPRRTFKDRMTLGRGSERIELHYFGRAHTGGDVWVLFPALRVVHAGDVFPQKSMPLVDPNNGGSAVEYPKTIANAVARLRNVDRVITGHFPTTLTMADLRTFGEFAREIVETVQAAKRSGRTLDEVAEGWKVPDRFVNDGYTQVGADPRMAVTRVRTNLVEVIWNETK